MSDSESNDFWKDFQISPTRVENAILGRFPWVVVIAIGPLLLLILESAVIDLAFFGELDPSFVFRDLSDPIFTFMSLAILLAGLVFVIRWRAQVEAAFRSLLEEDLISERDGKDLSESYLTFLRTYQRQLHSRKRFISVICIVALMLLISVVELEGRYATLNEFIHISQDPLQNLLLLTHMATRWALSAVLWGGFGGLALWVVAVTNHTVRNLTRSFQIRVQLMHPDRVGGLRPLGDLFSSLGLIILVFCIPLAVFGISGIRDVVKSRDCLDRLTPENRAILPMEEKELVDCLTAITRASLYGSYTTGDAVRAIRQAVSRGDSQIELLEQMADEFLEKEYDGSPLRDRILQRNRLPFMMIGGLVLVLLLVGLLVVGPYWTIHRSMVEQRESAVADMAREATALHGSLKHEVETHQWEKARATGEKLELVQRLLNTAAAAPSWPVSYPRVLRDYIVPALLSAGLSYGLTRLNVLLTPEGGLILEQFINALTGG